MEESLQKREGGEVHINGERREARYHSKNDDEPKGGVLW